MNNFKKNNKFGGGDRGGFKNRGGNDFGRNNEMHQATCADCGKTCEVPFRPNGKKPVFCKDCFAKNGGQVSTNDFTRRPLAPANNMPMSKPFGDDRKINEISDQLKSLNNKFEKLVNIAEVLLSKSEIEEIKSETKKPAPKKKK